MMLHYLHVLKDALILISCTPLDLLTLNLNQMERIVTTLSMNIGLKLNFLNLFISKWIIEHGPYDTLVLREPQPTQVA